MEQKNIARKINNGFCIVERQIVWVMFVIMLALLLAQVLCRYVFSMPLAWADEMVRYVYIATSFLGATIAAGENSHIQINILPAILAKPIKDENKRNLVLDYFNIVAYAVTIVFFVFITMWMINYNIDIMNKNQITTSNRWPMWLMCLPVTISCGLMGIQYVLNFIEALIDIVQRHKINAAAKKTGGAQA